MASSSAQEETEDYQSLLQEEDYIIKEEKYDEVEYIVFEDGDDNIEGYIEEVVEDVLEENYEEIEELESKYKDDAMSLDSGASPQHRVPSSLDLKCKQSTHTSDFGECSSVVQPCNVVVKYENTHQDDYVPMEENTFHLADEHQIFESPQVADRSQTIVRGRGRPRGRRQNMSGPQSWKEDGLIEVYMNDKDVSDELRESVMKVVNARLAAKVRATNRANQKITEAPKICDEWVDTDDYADAMLNADETLKQLKWSSMHDYSGQKEKFLLQRTGAIVPSENAYEAFTQYWDDGVLSYIVTMTNGYAKKVASSSTRFANEWYDTNIHEILVLFCFWIMLGIIRMPTIKTCFTLNPLLQTYIFRKMFTRTRYEHLCRAFHFNDDNEQAFCFSPVFNHLNTRFMDTYIPTQNICIDESWSLLKDNLSFYHYIKLKTGRYGMKIFELCESATGYLWSFYFYLGSATNNKPKKPTTLSKSSSIALKLIHPILDKGYTLFIDSWFNSPLLAKFLKKRKTDCVGKLSSNCNDIPPLISLCNLNKGEFVARHSGDVTVLAFQDRTQKVTTISTYHGNKQCQSQDKPQVILDYNKNMGGVDRKDQMLGPYLLEKTKYEKWDIKIFKRMLNCSILNARVLLQSSTGSCKDQLVFRLELVELILKRHLAHVPKPTPKRKVSSTLNVDEKEMFRQKHWPQQITAHMKSGRRTRRRCAWCAKYSTIQRRTSFICSDCQVPLCINQCFKLYHDKL